MIEQISEVPYAVVVNDEEQYSVWRTTRDVPAGWKEVGFRGSKEACLDHIAEIWTDIRPRSVRQALEEHVAGE